MFEIINWNINQGWESITSIITQTTTLRRVKRGDEEGFCQFYWHLLTTIRIFSCGRITHCYPSLTAVAYI